MAIPDFQTVMRPLLEIASDGNEHALADAREGLAQVFKLTDQETKELLPSGRQAIFSNRVAWAKVYLTRAGALAAPRRGYFQVTERGRQLLREVPKRITIRELMERFPEIAEFRAPKQHKDAVAPAVEDEGQTPEEMLENAYQRFRNNIASELFAG
jgi:restriction system protein